MNPSEEIVFRKRAQKDGISHISTSVAVLRDNKILIVRRAAADYLGSQYELPGGGVNSGEAIINSAIRELKEETGLTVSTILSVFDYISDRKPRVHQINFLADAEDDDILLNPDEHDEFRWADAGTDLRSLMSANMHICVAPPSNSSTNYICIYLHLKSTLSELEVSTARYHHT